MERLARGSRETGLTHSWTSAVQNTSYYFQATIVQSLLRVSAKMKRDKLLQEFGESDNVHRG